MRISIIHVKWLHSTVPDISAFSVSLETHKVVNEITVWFKYKKYTLYYYIHYRDGMLSTVAQFPMYEKS